MQAMKRWSGVATRAGVKELDIDGWEAGRWEEGWRGAPWPARAVG